MKVFMIGGTGLLGSEAAKELIARGHEVTSIALPPLPQGAVLPPEMKIEYGNYLEMTDDEIRAHFKGCEGFVFAAGVDERVEGTLVTTVMAVMKGISFVRVHDVKQTRQALDVWQALCQSV